MVATLPKSVFFCLNVKTMTQKPTQKRNEIIEANTQSDKRKVL